MTVLNPCTGATQANGVDEIHTDALGRIKVQFHFQRVAGGADVSTASTWVRVLQRYAGAGMGLQFIPRIGQEVLVDFIEGDIDRPLVVGALYNGKGEAGTPPTPGGLAASADLSAALSGFKTKEFGGGGFNQLVLDDSDQQLRLQLATTQHAARPIGPSRDAKTKTHFAAGD